MSPQSLMQQLKKYVRKPRLQREISKWYQRGKKPMQRKRKSKQRIREPIPFLLSVIFGHFNPYRVAFAVVHFSFFLINLFIYIYDIPLSVFVKVILFLHVCILNELFSSLDATWVNKRLIDWIAVSKTVHRSTFFSIHYQSKIRSGSAP